MKRRTSIVSLISLAGIASAIAVFTPFLAPASNAKEITITSGPGKVRLIELFTSEGCSSCPPAEKWFSTLRQSPRLWKEVVPLSFHVDYWDRLGWKDALASKEATARQQAYAAAWRAGNAYTPCFVLDGQEWLKRDFSSIDTGKTQPGNLSATLGDGGVVKVSFAPKDAGLGKLTAHVALLGMGLSTEVKAGENSGRTLTHDFAVLSHEEAAVKGEVELHVPADKVKPGKSALAVWITEEGHSEPVQAAGGSF